MPERYRSIAIVGDGPVGAALGARLARAGRRVVLFGRGQRPPLLVGESLVPAIVPHLREFGVEEEVASYGVFKPGATFVLNPSESERVSFADWPGRMPDYAYNVPRDRFDATLLRCAERAGVRMVHGAARVERTAGAGGGVRLSDETLAAAGLDAQPDLVVDASGRTRLLARLLDLPTSEGQRRDAALFAHHTGIPLANPGHIHTDRLAHGWCWRIPLRGRVSLGVVVPAEVIGRFGAGAEEQYDRYLRQDSWLKGLTENAQRLTPVMRYTNYQLTTHRVFGPVPGAPRWALVGDALGFVDPVFSSGLNIGLDGARALAAAVAKGTPRAFAAYERRMVALLGAWQRAVGYFYDGRLFTLLKVKEEVAGTRLGRLVNGHVGPHVARIFTGEGPAHPYSRRLVDFLMRHGLFDHDPTDYRVA